MFLRHTGRSLYRVGPKYKWIYGRPTFYSGLLWWFYSLQEMLNQSLAKAVFISASPLSIVEHPLWIEFFKKIRPSYFFPSRYRLSSTYLDAQYTKMQSEINKQLQDTKNLYMQCDGWSNLRNESISISLSQSLSHIL